MNQNHDFQKLAEKQKVMEQFRTSEGEKLVFSDKVSKINENGWSQTRTLAITSEKVYNFDGSKQKRAIPIDLIGGISRNMQGTKKREEFTIHVPSQYDYRFNSEKRDKICTLLKCLWAMKKKDNLPIFDIQENHLKNFTTTERDVKRGIDKFPPKDYRNTIEDLVDEVPTKKAPKDDGGMDFGAGEEEED